MRFRPCIDLHEGVVKQIVGGTLKDASSDVVTNFVASKPAEDFARRVNSDHFGQGVRVDRGTARAQSRRR